MLVGLDKEGCIAVVILYHTFFIHIHDFWWCIAVVFWSVHTLSRVVHGTMLEGHPVVCEVAAICAYGLVLLELNNGDGMVKVSILNLLMRTSHCDGF